MTSKKMTDNTIKFEGKRNFILLKGKTFAVYRIIFHINDCYSLKELSRFNHKFQLLFQKFESKTLQLNLAYIDSIFSVILADLTLDVFLNKINSFEGYLKAEKSILITDEKFDKIYFRHKIVDFIRFLLYSDVSKNLPFNGDMEYDKIYCMKNNNGEIDYYTIYDRPKLYEFLLEKMKLMIDLKSSTISENEVNLCLKIYLE
jgi:hypothetical protein